MKGEMNHIVVKRQRGLVHQFFRLTCMAIVAIATGVYIYYMCGQMNVEQQRQSRVHPKIKVWEPRKCASVLETATNGQWWLKPDITTADLQARRQLDMLLRKRKGWPRFLSHGDLRCGKNFPLPRPNFVKNKTMIFDIQGQCDPGSDTPCCHGYTGWCGSGAQFCNCSSCIDYRRFVPAELAQWLPETKCHITNFTQTSACALLRRRVSYITFVGDSLVRHLFSALLLILTNDATHGALKISSNREQKKICRKESQFIDSMCHVHTAMRWKDISKHRTFCPHRSMNFKMDFVEAYNMDHSRIAMRFIKRMLFRRGAVVLIGVGIHNGFNASLIISSYLGPILEMVDKSRTNTGWPHLIWLNPHSAGPLKPLSFYRRQGNPAISQFNRQMRAYCESHNVTVFDSYNMTLGVHSYDGTHYGFGVNMLKAQVLLNYLKETFEKM